MFRFRLVLSMIAAGAVAAHAAYALRAGSTVPPSGRLSDGVPYVVPVVSDRAAFELAFSSDERYLLIASALGDAGRTFDVTIRGADDADGRTSLLTPLAPLAATRPAATALPWTTASEPDVTTPSPRREFFLHVTDGPLDDPRQYTRVAGRVVAERSGVRVYLDEQQSVEELAPGLADEIAQRLEGEIIPAYRQRFGACRDVDGDGALTVLLTPWLGRLQGGRTSVAGFVRGADFDAAIEAPFGNRCDMLYLNSSLSGGESLQALLAHEFMHAVSASIRLPGGATREGLIAPADWLNEALAHLGENLLSSSWANLDHRVSRYLASPQEAPLTVEDYYRAGRWRDHGCRGATYLFLRWCVEQSGEELLPALVYSRGRGEDAFENAMGVPFRELYRHWSVALARQDALGAGDAEPTSLAPVPLRGRIGREEVGGPRRIPVDLSEGQRLFRVCGTATAYLELSSRRPGRQRVRIEAAPGADLQITLIRMAAGRNRIRPMRCRRGSVGDRRCSRESTLKW